MRLALLIAATAALALPAVAAAKEVTALDVCGTDGCTRIADRDALRSFEQAGELAEAAPAGLQRSYVLRVHMRDAAGGSQIGWTSLWLPAAGVVAFDGGQPGQTFSPVGPALERVLRHAARGRTAQAARDYSVPPPSPVARVAEVVPAPPARSADAAPSRPPALAWTGLAAVVLLAGGALRARRR